MYKNNGYMYQNTGTLRNAFGERIDSKDEDRIRRAIKLHNINRRIISKVKYFDQDIKSSITLYITTLFENVERVEIHDDGLWVDTVYKNGKKGLTAEEILKIEKLTGYPFDGQYAMGSRYVFTIEDEDIDIYTGLNMFPDETKKVQDYVRDGE